MIVSGFCSCHAAAVLSGDAEALATATVAHKSSAAAEAAYHIAATPFKVTLLHLDGCCSSSTRLTVLTVVGFSQPTPSGTLVIWHCNTTQVC